MEVVMREKIPDSRNKFEDLIQLAKNSKQRMNFLYSSLSKLVEPLQNLTPATRVDKQMSMNLSWVIKFQLKSIYIHQMISGRKGDPKEIGKARTRRLKINKSVKNASK